MSFFVRECGDATPGAKRSASYAMPAFLFPPLPLTKVLFLLVSATLFPILLCALPASSSRPQQCHA